MCDSFHGCLDDVIGCVSRVQADQCASSVRSFIGLLQPEQSGNKVQIDRRLILLEILDSFVNQYFIDFTFYFD